MKKGSYIGEYHHSIYATWDGHNWIKDCNGLSIDELELRRFLKLLEPTFGKLM